MNAWILDDSPGDYRFGAIDAPALGPDEVRVRLRASALNHMDLWVTRGMPKPPLPHVPGADGAGTIVEVGPAVGRAAGDPGVGDEVVINPSLSCGRCLACLSDQSPLCRQFGILGEHHRGTHGETVAVPARNVLPKPASLGWEAAAAYGLCAVTAWRMLKRARLTAGETLLVVGVGGGVSSFGLLLGVAMGARVYGTSRDAAKRRRAVEMGAVDAFDSETDFPVKADVVFENVGAATWDRSLRALVPGGRLVTCGGTAGSTVEVSLPRLFFKQHELIGSSMGSYREFAEVTSMVAGGVPVPVDETFALEDFPQALARLAAGRQSGKLVLDHGA